jgi:hypothetical protein
MLIRSKQQPGEPSLGTGRIRKTNKSKRVFYEKNEIQIKITGLRPENAASPVGNTRY